MGALKEPGWSRYEEIQNEDLSFDDILKSLAQPFKIFAPEMRMRES